MCVQVICEQLISYVEKLLPKKAEVAEEKKEVEHPAGVNLKVKADLDSDDPYASVRKTKGKKSKSLVCSQRSSFGPLGGDAS